MKADWDRITKKAVALGALPGYMGHKDLLRFERFQYFTMKALEKEVQDLVPETVIVSSRNNFDINRADPKYFGATHVKYDGNHAEVTWKFPWDSLQELGQQWDIDKFSTYLKTGKNND